MQLMQGTAGSDAATREQLLARGFVELSRATFGAEAEERALRSLRSLVEILLPRGWRFVDGYENPMLAALRGGPAPAAPPNLARYLTMLQEIVRAAQVGDDRRQGRRRGAQAHDAAVRRRQVRRLSAGISAGSVEAVARCRGR